MEEPGRRVKPSVAPNARGSGIESRGLATLGTFVERPAVPGPIIAIAPSLIRTQESLGRQTDQKLLSRELYYQ